MNSLGGNLLSTGSNNTTTEYLLIPQAFTPHLLNCNKEMDIHYSYLSIKHVILASAPPCSVKMYLQWGALDHIWPGTSPTGPSY